MPIAASMPRTIVKDVLTHVPKVMDEQWLRSTWQGAHGSHGLHADANVVFSKINLTADGMRGQAGMFGDVLDKYGRAVGEVEREVALHANGRVRVNHSLLDLHASSQGTGFARGFNDAAYPRYAAAGVDDVTVSAGLDAGGYVWAREGFELLTEPGLDDAARAVENARTIRRIVDDAVTDRRITSAQYETLQPRLLGSDDVVRADTLTDVRELARIDDVGKSALLGSSWRGFRTITNDAAAGAAHLRAEDARPAGVAAANQAVTELLPVALRPERFNRIVDEVVAGSDAPLTITKARTQINLVKGEIDAAADLRPPRDAGYAGPIKLAVRLDEQGGLVGSTTYQTWAVRMPKLEAAASNALRDAGVGRLEIIRDGTQPGGVIEQVIDLG